VHNGPRGQSWRGGLPVRRIAAFVVGSSLCTSAALTAFPATSSRVGAERPPLVSIPGNLGSLPPGATLVGPASSNTKLQLIVTLEPRDPAALATAVKSVSDPASPKYHHFLTPEQFASQYGPTATAVDSVRNLLKSDGLAVGQPSAAGLSLPVSGTVGQVASALSTLFSTYRLASGRTGYRANAPPQLPSNVASSVEGILGLDTLNPPQPTDLRAPPARPASAKPTSTNPTTGATPELAPGQPSPGASCAQAISNFEGQGALDAVELAQAYSFDPLYQTGQAADYGLGSTIALVELYGAGYSSSDIASFASCYGITLGNGQVSGRMNGVGTIGTGTEESELDIETALSLAPKANIEVYEGGPSDSIYSVLSRIVSDDSAKIVSVSWTNGCEAYVAQSEQQSEATLLQQSALEGQSVFAASGDQGSEGCNVNRETGAPTGSGPVAQAVDPLTGTLYVTDSSANSVTVDSEGSTNDPDGFSAAASVSTASGPAAVALDTTDKKVFVADAKANELTVFGTASCNATSTSGCGATTTITNTGNHLAGPGAMAVNGTTLYVVNTSSGAVAVYNAATNAYVASVALPKSSLPSAIAVDPKKGIVYVADSANARVEYFSATTCNSSTTTGCATTPTTIAVGMVPKSLAVDGPVGNLYVGNAGSGGGVTVISLSKESVSTTISTANAYGVGGYGLVQSVALSPSGSQVLAVLNGISFPGDVLATIDPGSETITATVYLESGTDTVGALVSDGVRGYAWVIDSSLDVDMVQNLNLAVDDPANQPGVTSVGGTSVSGLGPPPTETTWNDRLKFADGASGGGMSATFAMPDYQAALLGSSGSGPVPCSSGTCREVPDVSADADPSTGYIVYNTSNGLGGWTVFGGTSGGAPLWAAVLADVSSADGATSGLGDLNDALYALASASTSYFNDVTSGNNDYNGTNSGQYPAQPGYDMATGLGTPITSALASGLTRIPFDVAVSGTQPYQSTTPTFTGKPDYSGSGGDPPGVTLNTSGLKCMSVNGSTLISQGLAAGSYTLVASSCSGATLSGAGASNYVIVYTSATGDFMVQLPPWTQLSLTTSPSARFGASMAYDAAAGQLVLFGGFNANGPLNDTWTWNGSAWTQQFPTSIPPARFDASMAYDAAAGQLVLFSGADSNGLLNDTWTWNGTTWTKQSSTNSPAPRDMAPMAYDGDTGQLVLFGGALGGGIPDNGTYTWNGTTWTQLGPAASPTARQGGSMADDPASGQLVLFGGQNGSTLLNDTWIWTGTTWTPLAPTSSPPPREATSMDYDPMTGQILLFGGYMASGYINDSWNWNGATWTEQYPTTSPPARAYASMADDPASGQIVLFGGQNGNGYLGDTWALPSAAGPPTISDFSPASGSIGTKVRISGTNLAIATKVTIGGVAATILSATTSQIKIKVPTGATTGKIKVKTPSGTVKSAKVFTVP
jgi:DNA-binding beta-propeller fold protein YncE